MGRVNQRELANADYIIVLLSIAFSTSAFAKNEILNTFDRSKIIPILLKPYPYTRDSSFAESQVFLYARKNTNSVSFEEWQELSNISNDINGTFSNSFTKDLIAFIKDGNSDLLIGEEKYYKTGNLHLNNCGLSEIPAEVFQMSRLTILNLGNYHNDFNSSNNNFVHSGDISLKIKAQNSINKIDSRVKELQNLKHLSLERNSISGIENLEYNTNLVTLELGGNKITKISGLNKLIHLRTLFLYSNIIEKIEGIEELKNLEFLYLGGNKIQKLEGLNNLTKLREIYLPINTIQRLEGVNGLKYLTILELKNNSISSIDTLADLSNLTYLNLDHNKLHKLEGLENLKSLQRLHLENNKINKLEGLDSLNNLLLLHLENNQIKKIEGLDKLEKLQELDLQINKIEKVEGLDKLSSLTKLNLSENKIQNSSGILELDNLKDLKEINFKKNSFILEPSLTEEILEAIGDNKDKFFAFLLDMLNRRLQENYLPPIKIVLLGNSEDGKTSLALKLIDGWDSSNNEDSTPGLKVRTWEINDSKSALIYDFGGQDYYHSSYNMFLTWNTGYILVWDSARQTTQMIFKQKNNAPLSLENQYRVYPVKYWLGNLDYWKRKNTFAEQQIQIQFQVL
ncbi:MAG: leucine-rich repeat domain-containing protein [Saprospiraceae bacterium]|nr:leucine-rich repeat domain-containing protein [Saprospiraceae bacterium]